VYVDGKPDE